MILYNKFYVMSKRRKDITYIYAFPDLIKEEIGKKDLLQHFSRNFCRMQSRQFQTF